MSDEGSARSDRLARALRDPAQIVAQWEPAGPVDPALLHSRASPGWWDLLARLDVTLLVTREYEHLLVALSTLDGRPHATHLALPHPSGIAADLVRGDVHVAATRNPNQIYVLRPLAGMLTAQGSAARRAAGQAAHARDDRSSYPGALYLHDLAMVGGVLHGNAVGENAVVALPGGGVAERVWWPRAIETADGPEFGRNHLQLNSIAAGPDLASSALLGLG